jgi:hypothetical protein
MPNGSGQFTKAKIGSCSSEITVDLVKGNMSTYSRRAQRKRTLAAPLGRRRHRRFAPKRPWKAKCESSSTSSTMACFIHPKDKPPHIAVVRVIDVRFAVERMGIVDANSWRSPLSSPNDIPTH